MKGPDGNVGYFIVWGSWGEFGDHGDLYYPLDWTEYFYTHSQMRMDNWGQTDGGDIGPEPEPPDPGPGPTPPDPSTWDEILKALQTLIKLLEELLGKKHGKPRHRRRR
jgi:hypothetical protein